MREIQAAVIERAGVAPVIETLQLDDPRLHAGHADGLDHARALVAHDDRTGARPLAVAHVEVAVADA